MCVCVRLGRYIIWSVTVCAGSGQGEGGGGGGYYGQCGAPWSSPPCTLSRDATQKVRKSILVGHPSLLSSSLIPPLPP